MTHPVNTDATAIEANLRKKAMKARSENRREDSALQHAALEFIQLASAALIGVSRMLQVESNDYDEQMNLTHCSEASDVFRFFGETIAASADIAFSEMKRLQRDLET